MSGSKSGVFWTFGRIASRGDKKNHQKYERHNSFHMPDDRTLLPACPVSPSWLRRPGSALATTCWLSSTCFSHFNLCYDSPLRCWSEKQGDTHVSLKDVFEVAAAVIVSLGGGGAIVFRLSGFLGKLWADRALQTQKEESERQLEEQRQQYAQLNISFYASVGPCFQTSAGGVRTYRTSPQASYRK